MNLHGFLLIYMRGVTKHPKWLKSWFLGYIFYWKNTSNLKYPHFGLFS